MADETRPPALAVGHVLGITLNRDSAPERCYVGTVQALDDIGVRIRLMDWHYGTPLDLDLFVPWGEIRTALVATSEGEWGALKEEIVDWAKTMNRPEGDEEEE